MIGTIRPAQSSALRFGKQDKTALKTAADALRKQFPFVPMVHGTEISGKKVILFGVGNDHDVKVVKEQLKKIKGVKQDPKSGEFSFKNFPIDFTTGVVTLG